MKCFFLLLYMVLTALGLVHYCRALYVFPVVMTLQMNYVICALRKLTFVAVDLNDGNRHTT
jgi:hypothetical protein